MVFTKPLQWKKEDSERMTGEGDKIKFIDLGFERGQVVGFWKGRKEARRSINCTLRSELFDTVLR